MGQSKASEPQTQQISIRKYARNDGYATSDAVAVEEPLEIRLVFGSAMRRVMRSLSITMRTPGQDDELAVGFLWSESIIKSPGEIEGIERRGVLADGRPSGNIVRVDLRTDVHFDPSRLQRHFFTTSSCGVCGKASLESLLAQGVTPLSDSGPLVPSTVIYELPAALHSGQPTFDATGGLHAAGLFDTTGKVLATREDIGRHNAVDKLIGHFILKDATPLPRSVLVISGRASFEIMQKALVARIPMVVAVGAPSSLAVELARENNMSLIGFASERRFNVYSGFARLVDV